MIAVDWDAVEAFQQLPEIQALGVLGRQRATYAAFPEVEAHVKARSARRLERALWGRSFTPDPDKE